MTSGGSSFEQGEDFVAARLSFDIPTDGIASLREITQEVDRFRTSIEAASRGGSNFVDYLRQIAETATRTNTALENVSNSLERQAELSGRQATGSSPDLNAPPQYTAPFNPAQLGTGVGRVPTTVPTMPQVQDQLDELRASNPRAYVNKMAASGGLQKGDLAGGQASQVAETAERISAREALGAAVGKTGATQSVMNELGSGLLSGAGKMGGFGAAGLGVGAAALGYGALQSAGGMYQGLKNMGSVRGGGAAEGLGYEAQIRTMAMSPFISTEQARQIVQQGLKEGYTGKEFDTVTQFVSQNLKNMNMDISDSFEVMRKNVNEGGQSLTGLNATLAELKDLSKTGARSLPELLQGYKDTSSALISSGTQGGAASQTALSAGQVFSDSQTSKGTGEGLVQAFNNPTGMMYMREAGGLKMPPGSEGIIPQAQAFLMGPNAGLAGASTAIKQWALQIWNDRGKPPPPAEGETPSPAFAECMALWQMRLQRQGVPWANDAPKVREWFVAYVSNRDPAQEGIKKADDQAGAITERQAASPVGAGQLLGSAGGGKSLMAELGGVGTSFLHSITSGKDWDKVGSALSSMGQPEGDAVSRQGGAHNAILDEVMRSFGKDKVELVDSSGKTQKITNTREQLEQLNNDQLKWRQQGESGPGHSLRETPMDQSGIKSLGGSPGSSRVSGELQITVSPEAQKAGIQAPSTVHLSPHEQESNSAYGGSTPNNAPPGYELPRRRY